MAARSIKQTHADSPLPLAAMLVESAADAIIGTNTNGVITSWNRAAERLYGYSVQEVRRQEHCLASAERSRR